MYLLLKAMPKGKGRDSAVKNSQLFVLISKLAACTVEAIHGVDSFLEDLLLRIHDGGRCLLAIKFEGR